MISSWGTMRYHGSLKQSKAALKLLVSPLSISFHVFRRKPGRGWVRCTPGVKLGIILNEPQWLVQSQHARIHEVDFSLWQCRCFPRPRGYPWPGATDPTWIYVVSSNVGHFRCGLPVALAHVDLAVTPSGTREHGDRPRFWSIWSWWLLASAGCTESHRDSRYGNPRAPRTIPGRRSLVNLQQQQQHAVRLASKCCSTSCASLENEKDCLKRFRVFPSLANCYVQIIFCRFL